MLSDSSFEEAQQLAYVYLCHQQWANAGSVYGWLCVARPDEPRSRVAWAYTLLERGLSRRALEVLEPLGSSASSIARLLRGRALACEGQLGESAAELRAYVDSRIADLP